jgi:RNA polymerase sigma factor (sigma-70 family)
VAAVPSIGRASRIERPAAPGADAASVLYERYSAQIFSYCLHQLGSREEAEDAVQTTFMNAFRGLSRGIVPELESAWLFKIAHNVCLSRRRSSWRRGRVEAPNNFEVLQETVAGREQVSDELIGLPDVLEEMPENQRRAILLREWQGLTYREISGELGLSQAAVETLIFRARRALAQGLEQDAVTWKKRVVRGANLGGGLACLKALLGGGGTAAVKVAATAVAVATAAMAGAGEPSSTHTRRAPAAKPRIASYAAKPSRSSAVGRTRSLAVSRVERTSATKPRAKAGVRKLPHPVAWAPSRPDTTASAPTPPVQSAPASVTPNAGEPDVAVSAAPAPAVAAPEPAANGNGNGSDGTAERRPQSTQASTAEPMPTPDPAPAEPAAAPTPPGLENKPEKPDKPDKPDKSDKPDKPDNGHGNDNK